MLPTRLLDPIFKGDYPPEMRHRAGDRLPQFSAEEQTLLRGSVDFVGLNHYTSKYVSEAEHDAAAEPNHFTDQGVDVSRELRPLRASCSAFEAPRCCSFSVHVWIMRASDHRE